MTERLRLAETSNGKISSTSSQRVLQSVGRSSYYKLQLHCLERYSLKTMPVRKQTHWTTNK
jgi:hypothetical protein